MSTEKPKRPTSDKEILDKEPIRRGLENVIVDTTTICSIDGYMGKLYYRGYSIDELANNASFEEVAFLLLFEKLPSFFELEFFKEKLISERAIPDRILMILQSFPRVTTRIELLRTAISALSLYDEDYDDSSKQANIRKGMRIIAKIPTILAYSHRIKENLPLVEPSDELSHAGNFYYMMTGRKPTEAVDKAFDLLLILQAEHSINASTFSARVTCSTLSDLYSAVTSAIGTLRGELHGGANEKVIKFITEEVKTLDNAIPWVKNKIAKKEKVMGMGHRVYKTIDPRATILKKVAKTQWEKIVEDHPEDANFYKICRTIEDYVKEEKGLEPNVDFYSAIVMNGLGIPSALFTPLFAASRSAGWIAHSIEQLADNKMLRPRLRYLGELDRKYEDINDR